jgi:hypothetical protein
MDEDDGGDDEDGDGEDDGGDDEDGDVDADDGGAETEDVDGWSDTDCTVTGWLEGLGLGELVAARAVPAATTEITTPTAMAALTAPIRRSRGIRYTVVPCTAGGAPRGHSAASRSAASPRWDRPRSCQSWP